MIRRLLLAAALFIAGPAAAAAQSPAAPGVAAEDRRVLVMLRLAPEHYRPGSDYGGGGGYGDPTAAAARRRLALRIARDEGLTLLDNWPMPLLGIDCVIMTVPAGRTVEAAADHLSHVAGVAWSQPLHEYVTQAAPASAVGDRLFAAQPAARQWRLAQLHRIATGRGARVAVIDSGVDAGHPDLRGQVALVRDFVGVGAGSARGAELHGTGVAGIIGARAGNGVGIAGVAPGARILGLRACRQRTGGTTCDTLSLARALVFAIEQGSDVVNMSLTGPHDTLIARLVAAGIARGTQVVAAIDPRSGAGFPATLPGVIAVAQDGVAGARTGVYTAPGRDVPTTEPGGRWYLVSGNSYAAAHVSGLLALMREAGRSRRAGRGPSSGFVSARSGGGAIDACDTVRRLAALPAGACRAVP